MISATVTVAAAGCPRSAIAATFRPRASLKAPNRKALKGICAGTLLGTPSTVGTFDKEVWYYIGRRTEKWAFFDEFVIQQQVVVLLLDPTGKVEHIQRYDENDGREVDLVEGKTPIGP